MLRGRVGDAMPAAMAPATKSLIGALVVIGLAAVGVIMLGVLGG